MPAFYKDSVFIVDRLHAFGHQNCSPAFDANLHLSLQGVNTQQCEQLFSKFNFSLSTLAFMSQHNFVHILSAGLDLLMKVNKFGKATWKEVGEVEYE